MVRITAALLGALVVVLAGPGVAVAATTAPQSQALVLAFDTSRSVSDEQFAQAQQVTSELVAELLEEGTVDVGLVAFGEEAVVVADVGSDLPTLQAGIAGLSNDSGETAAMSAVDVSLDMLEPYGLGVAIFVTDGVDTALDLDAAGLSAAASERADRAQEQGSVVSAVNIEGRLPFSVEFQQLVDATEGQTYPVAGTADIADEFRVQLANAVERVRRTPPPLEPSAEAAPVQSVPPTTDATVAAAAPPPRGEPWPREVALGAAGGMFAAAVVGGLVLSGIAGRASSPEVRRQKALAAYTPLPDRAPPRAPAAPTRLGDNVVARQAVDVAGRLIDRGDTEARLTKRLEAADLALRPGEWVVIQAGISVVLGLILLILTLGNPLAALVGVGIGVAGTALFIRLRADRRQRAFHAALPDTLQLLASTLRVGHSLPQAMDSVVREGREPIRTEFQRALVEARLGVPAEKSLDDIADRVGSEDFRWVVMSIRIQREVGGNLAELLDTVAETIRERERLRRHVAGLSAEGRLSAWIVGALPVVFVVYLLVARPGYLTPLVTDPLGIFFLVMAVALFTAGLFGLRWATKVDL